MDSAISTVMVVVVSGVVAWLVSKAIAKDRQAAPPPLVEDKLILKPRTSIFWGAIIPTNIVLLLLTLMFIIWNEYSALIPIAILFIILNITWLRRYRYVLTISKDGLIIYEKWKTKKVVIRSDEVAGIRWKRFGKGLEIYTSDGRSAYVLLDLHSSPHVARFIQRAWADKLSTGAKRAIRKTLDPKPWDFLGG